ncbi:hypothetical protein CMUS01_00971 [Colletotrichum musicola]|uniref:Uncharacterized protein n=1 Tax=Colletotrichum musicola TaxID=2175873 RepID=A0A8H6NXT0_9PEZI|nr:hypothetical protein CMUS01_00971 [Colletotrichum musicola]
MARQAPPSSFSSGAEAARARESCQKRRSTAVILQTPVGTTIDWACGWKEVPETGQGVCMTAPKAGRFVTRSR